MNCRLSIRVYLMGKLVAQITNDSTKELSVMNPRPTSGSPKRVALLVTFVCALLTPAIALACLWDFETTLMERQPRALEVMTGKFLRHSPEYYRWRIKDRQARLVSTKDPAKIQAYSDDIAVAYDKLGEHQKAIDLMTKQLAMDDQRYESLANLGTFYIHNGDMEKGLEFIHKAIAVNPDAHFGREIYQAYLVEYVLEVRKARRDANPDISEEEVTSLPLTVKHRTIWAAPTEFAGFLLKRLEIEPTGSDHQT